MAEQLQRMGSAAGFVAALDQSGGSTPQALALYGIGESAYQGEAQMFDLVHEMRTRIVTAPCFDSRVLGAILFQNTLDRDICGAPSSEYLWREKGIVPFLKIDYGLRDVERGVQTLKPVPDLAERLPAARDRCVFGTKMRSVIRSADAEGIAAVVEQQFALGSEVRSHGLVPIIEPEVDIHAPDKAACEHLLRDSLRRALDGMDGDLPVIFKLTLPQADNYYREFCGHPKVLRVVALSGGYSRTVANAKLAANDGVIASFSRALTEGLSAAMDDAAFAAALDDAIAAIAAASAS